MAGGEKLIGKAVCNPLVWKMQDLEFQYQLRVLKLGENGMVLGVDWLSQFNLILFDFNRGSIKFNFDGEEIDLKSESSKRNFMMVASSEAS